MIRRVHRDSEGDDPSEWQSTEEGRQALNTDPERLAWAEIGRSLYLGRKRLQISKREAARRAGISEALWRQLEGGGEMMTTGTFLPNPRTDNLVAAALAVGEDPAGFFSRLGRDAPENIERFAGGGFTIRFNLLDDHDQAVVIMLVESMLMMRKYQDITLPD
jgi:transcriptional regulator with XRE-family HTH domain